MFGNHWNPEFNKIIENFYNRWLTSMNLSTLNQTSPSHWYISLNWWPSSPLRESIFLRLIIFFWSLQKKRSKIKTPTKLSTDFVLFIVELRRETEDNCIAFTADQNWNLKVFSGRIDSHQNETKPKTHKSFLIFDEIVWFWREISKQLNREFWLSIERAKQITFV